MCNREYLIRRLADSGYGRWVQLNWRMLQQEHRRERLENHCSRKVVQASLVLVGTLAGSLLMGEKAILILAGGCWGVMRDDLRWAGKARRKRQVYRRDFPRLISNYIIFLEAGYPVETALRRTCEMGRDNEIKAAFRRAYQEIDHGASRNDAFGRIVSQLREPNLSKMIFLTLQGIRLGENQMVRSLHLLSETCWKAQMDEIRMRSEKASAKMVFPMMLIFMGISLLTLTPGLIALLQFG